MTDNTESVSRSTDEESFMMITPSTAEGRSRVLLFGGLGSLAVGNLVQHSTLVWAGTTIIGIAFLLNSIGKLVHYRSLPIPSRDQFVLSGTWTMLAVTVLGLLVNFAYTRYGPGDGAYFWSLAVGGVGFALLQMAAQSLYLPEHEIE